MRRVGLHVAVERREEAALGLVRAPAPGAVGVVHGVVDALDELRVRGSRRAGARTQWDIAPREGQERTEAGGRHGGLTHVVARGPDVRRDVRDHARRPRAREHPDPDGLAALCRAAAGSVSKIYACVRDAQDAP